MDAGKLVTPKVIPKDIKIIKEDAPDMSSMGMQGGVVGGVAGGQMGGVIGGVIGGVGGAPPPPKPTQTRIRQGGNVTAAKLDEQGSAAILRWRDRREFPELLIARHYRKEWRGRTTGSDVRASAVGASRAGRCEAVEVPGHDPERRTGGSGYHDRRDFLSEPVTGFVTACAVFSARRGAGVAGRVERFQQKLLRSIRMVATLYVSAAIFLQSATTSTWSLQSMWSTMSTLPRVVVGILFVLSVYSFGVMIDRALMYSAARKQSRVFVQQVAGALKEGKLDEAISIAERNKKSHIAKVVATGLSEFQSASQQVSDAEVIEAAKRGLERSVAIVHAEMKRGLSALATIGSTAPFVGLFGTVVGIFNAFKGIRDQQSDRAFGGSRRYR